LKHIIHGLYDTAVAPSLMMSQGSHTRGNVYKSQKMYSSMILENIFTERVVKLWNSLLWNSLPSLVVEAPSLNCLKTLLVKFWSNQDVVYDFKAPFLETESRNHF